jgi:exodeoxyribonuclease-5
MAWSPDQEEALKRITEWLRSGEPRFSLGGYAGTGKTTLARYIAEEHGGRVKFAAFTGKAASVLRRKGCPGATTIHRLIYQPKGKSGESEIQELRDYIEQELRKKEPDHRLLTSWRKDLADKEVDSSSMFSLREEAEITEASLVIVDESSMVDRRMGSDLESFGIPILYLGDPGQLPPVRGKAHLGPNDYDFVLEHIHRQAADSPIIQLAQKVRSGEACSYGKMGDAVEILRKKDWDRDLVTQADQVITGSNLSRFKITRQMRAYLGRDVLYPVEGDKLICRLNDHDRQLLNGVTATASTEMKLLHGNKLGRMGIEYDGRNLTDCLVDPGYFQENYGDRSVWPRGSGIMHFDYGYVVTAHKSQGAEWPHVVVADDRMRVNDREHRRRWLYTAITRASEKLTIYI